MGKTSEENEMTHEHATQLADWIESNTRGYAKRDGEKIYIEGKIDAFELLLYAQSLLRTSNSGDIYANNRVAYTGRTSGDRSNAVVEGADW
jgi:hypothetical protein